MDPFIELEHHMLIRKTLLLSAGVVALASFAVLMAGSGFSGSGITEDEQLAAAPTASPVEVITVYKTPSCGCCALWVDHLEESGLTVDSVTVEETHSVRSKFGVPHELASCHTATAGDYWIEGHVPADLIEQLLRDKPDDIRGIAVPGMPAGSPGMETPNPVTYRVLSVMTDGTVSVHAVRQGQAN